MTGSSRARSITASRSARGLPVLPCLVVSLVDVAVRPGVRQRLSIPQAVISPVAARLSGGRGLEHGLLAIARTTTAWR